MWVELVGWAWLLESQRWQEDGVREVGDMESGGGRWEGGGSRLQAKWQPASSIRATLGLSLTSSLAWVKVKSLSRVRLFAAPQTVAYQAPLSMGLSRQQYWSRLPFPSPGHLPNSGLKLGSPALQTDALPSEPPGKSQPGWLVHF